MRASEILVVVIIRWDSAPSRVANILITSLAKNIKDYEATKKHPQQKILNKHMA